MPDVVEILRGILESDLLLIADSAPELEQYRAWELRRTELFGLLEVSDPASSSNRASINALIEEIAAVENTIVTRLEQKLTGVAEEMRALKLLGQGIADGGREQAFFMERLA